MDKRTDICALAFTLGWRLDPLHVAGRYKRLRAILQTKTKRLSTKFATAHDVITVSYQEMNGHFLMFFFVR